MAEDTADFQTSDVHLFSLYSPKKRSTAFTASWSVTTSEKTECSLHSFRVCADTLARPSVVAMLHSKKSVSQSVLRKKKVRKILTTAIFVYLLISGKVISSPAFIAALRLCAPMVSMATTGTSAQSA